MKEDMNARARSRITRFQQRIKETEQHFDQIEPTGRYTARSLLVRKFKIHHLLEWLKAEGEEADISQLIQEFEKANTEFERFRAEKGEEYVKKLHEELEYLLRTYPRLICHFMRLDPVELETQNDLDVRDALEILMIELDESANLEEEKLKVETLDEVFECVYDNRLRELLEIVESEYGPEIEKPYLPSRFWWRHPSEHERWWETIEEVLSDQDDGEPQDNTS